MWKESDNQIILQVKTQRGDVVLSSAAATVAA